MQNSAATTSPARCTTPWAYSNGTTALGIAVGLGEIKMPRAEQICKDLDLYSSVASCSSGVELTQAQIVLLGNKAGAGGRYRIGHAVMKDALDMDGIYAAIRNAGLDLPERAACGGPRRPRRQLLHEMRGRPPRHPARPPPDHAGRFRRPPPPPLPKPPSAASLRAAIGDPAVFVSVDAMHQGPQGGGPVIAIIDAGE